jgi:hypothetical protein
MQFAVTAGKWVERVTDYLLQQHHKLSVPVQQIDKGLKGNGALHCTKLRTACKFACGIRELQAALIMFTIYRKRT